MGHCLEGAIEPCVGVRAPVLRPAGGWDPPGQSDLIDMRVNLPDTAGDER